MPKRKSKVKKQKNLSERERNKCADVLDSSAHGNWDDVEDDISSASYKPRHLDYCEKFSTEESPTTGEPLIVLASRAGRDDLVQLIVDRGGDINKRGWENRTALFECAKALNVNMVLWLVENGADPNIEEKVFRRTACRDTKHGPKYYNLYLHSSPLQQALRAAVSAREKLKLSDAASERHVREFHGMAHAVVKSLLINSDVTKDSDRTLLEQLGDPKLTALFDDVHAKSKKNGSKARDALRPDEDEVRRKSASYDFGTVGWNLLRWSRRRASKKRRARSSLSRDSSASSDSGSVAVVERCTKETPTVDAGDTAAEEDKHKAKSSFDAKTFYILFYSILLVVVGSISWASVFR